MPKQLPQNKPNLRPDHGRGHRTIYERNRKRIIATQSVCALCGRLVDKSLKWPDPYSATVDHIIPISRGGHPSDLNNLQLAHLICNRDKANKLLAARSEDKEAGEGTIPNTVLPWAIDWTRYRADDAGTNAQLEAEAQALRQRGMMLTAHGIQPIR